MKLLLKTHKKLLIRFLLKEINKQKIIKKTDVLDKNKTVGLYWPMQGEVDIMKLAVKFPSKAALPKIKGTKMYYVKYGYNSKMEKSSFSKLMQPQNENKVEPNIIVIPGFVSQYKWG